MDGCSLGHLVLGKVPHASSHGVNEGCGCYWKHSLIHSFVAHLGKKFLLLYSPWSHVPLGMLVFFWTKVTACVRSVFCRPGLRPSTAGELFPFSAEQACPWPLSLIIFAPCLSGVTLSLVPDWRWYECLWTVSWLWYVPEAVKHEEAKWLDGTEV